MDEADEAAEVAAEEEQREEERPPDVVAVQAPEAVPSHGNLASRNPKRRSESEKRQREKAWPRHRPTDTHSSQPRRHYLSASLVPRREDE